MRRLLLIAAVGLALMVAPGRARGQVYSSGPVPFRVNASIGMPGLYGTSWGEASYGIPRTYTTFSSPYGGGSGYGYPNYGYVAPKYNVGLWRSGVAAPGYLYGSANGYNTFPYPYLPGGPMYGPSIGVYAPGFGPGGLATYYKP